MVSTSLIHNMCKTELDSHKWNFVWVISRISKQPVAYENLKIVWRQPNYRR